jgi:hypothetical protein
MNMKIWLNDELDHKGGRERKRDPLSCVCSSAPIVRPSSHIIGLARERDMLQ